MESNQKEKLLGSELAPAGPPPSNGKRSWSSYVLGG